MSSVESISETNTISAHHIQRPAIIPTALARINQPSMEHLIPSLTETTPNERLNLAIDVFEQLIEIDDEMKIPHRWSLNLLDASKNNSTRDFLIEENVLDGGKYLYCPEPVVPGMEIANLNPNKYPPDLRKDIQRLKGSFFDEYLYVKSVLAPPGVDNLSFFRPKLKTSSFLIKDFTDNVQGLAKSNGDNTPLVAIFGPGAGEEIVPLIKGGISVLTYDNQDGKISEGLIKKTFALSGEKEPEINILKTNGEVDASGLDSWNASNQKKPTIFICPDIDFSKENAIPSNLQEKTTLSASLYAYHEIPHSKKDNFIQNMSDASQRMILVVDGMPTPEALDNVILPVIEKTDMKLTGTQAVITHILCSPPDVTQKQARRAAEDINWQSDIIKVPFPPPLLHPLQQRLIGVKK